MSALYDVIKFVASLPMNDDPTSPYYGKVVIDPEDFEEKLAEFMRNRGCFPEPNSTFKYFVNGNEVTKTEYVAAERRNGFRNTIGFPEEPATSSWSNSKTGDHGRQVFVRAVHENSVEG
jgi:hypothetical protein